MSWQIRIVRFIHEADNSEALYESFNKNDTIFISQHKYAQLSFTVHVCCKCTYGRDVYSISFTEGFD